MVADAKRTPLVDESDVFVPQFEIRVDGSPISPAIASEVSEIDYRDGLGEVATLEFVIDDWDADEQRFTYSENDTFLPGRRLGVSLGHRDGDLIALFDGRITYLQTDFSRGSHPRLIVGAVDLLHDLRTEQRSITYEEKTDGDIAKEIADRLGLDIETRTGGSAEPAHPFLFQRNQYDVQFLLDRARVLGYELTVSISEKSGQASLYFGPSLDGDQPEYRLTYGRNLFSFRGCLDISNQVDAVVVRTWDPTNKEVQETESSSTRVEGVPSGAGRSRIASGFEKRREIIVDEAVASVSEGTALAQGVHDDIRRRILVATGETSGLPRLRAGRKVILEGLGDRFSGTYFVTATRHRLGPNGYETRFDGRREEAS